MKITDLNYILTILVRCNYNTLKAEGISHTRLWGCPARGCGDVLHEAVGMSRTRLRGCPARGCGDVLHEAVESE
jgi:hypothetical protein